MTISLMSTDMMTLQILVNGGGSAKEQKYGTLAFPCGSCHADSIAGYLTSIHTTTTASRIMGVMKKRHLLLATLFIANAAAMSALPVILYLYAIAPIRSSM
jgi:hypothetical protein